MTAVTCELTTAQIHILSHALGVADDARTLRGAYRSYYSSGPLCANWPVLLEMVELGLLRHDPEGFRVTKAGIAALKAVQKQRRGNRRMDRLTKQFEADVAELPGWLKVEE